jgi:hypothetical protein
MFDYKIQIVPKQLDLFLLESQLNDLTYVEYFKNKIDQGITTSSNSNKTNVKGKMTDWTYFNEDPMFKKFLMEINDLMFKFLQPFQKLVLQSSWGNILEENNYVEPHQHIGSNISGILYLTENGPGTDFPDFKKTTEEKIGKFVLFHPHSLHGVKQSNLKEKRYSLAFNLYATNYWE